MNLVLNSGRGLRKKKTMCILSGLSHASGFCFIRKTSTENICLAYYSTFVLKAARY